MVLCLLTTDFTGESSVSLLDLASASARSLFLLTPTCCRNTNQQQAPAGDDQLAELREIFRSFDRNNDGSLTQLELGSLLRSLGLRPSADQLDALIQRADTNSNGLVEFSEFVALVALDLLDDRSPYCEDQLRRLFGILDRDGNGFITAAELAHSMAKLLLQLVRRDVVDI